MSQEDRPRARRFAKVSDEAFFLDAHHYLTQTKACDSCHRRKVKCYWREPACPDCVKLGVPCTFTTKHLKPRKANRSKTATRDETREETIQESETLPIVAEDSHEHATEEERAVEDGSGLPSLHNAQALIDEYFAKRNHFLPIIDKEAFEFDPSGDNIQQATSNLMICATFQYRGTDSSEPTSAQDSHKHAENHLGQALKRLASFDSLQPDFPTIQALILMSDCLAKSPTSYHKGLIYIAAAARLVHLLGIHNLDRQSGLSAKQRLERIRTLWCLYILDHEASFLHDIPCLLQDDELRVIDPKKFSEDSRGLVMSVDGSSAINLFTARQRLAVILGNIYKSLWTFRGRNQPLAIRSDIAQRLSTALLDWRKEWFDFGPPCQNSPTNWPMQTCAPMVRLYLLYFMALLKATAGTNSIVDIVKEMANDDSPAHQFAFDPIKPALSPTIVDAARTALQVALIVRLGDLTYLM